MRPAKPGQTRRTFAAVLLLVLFGTIGAVVLWLERSGPPAAPELVLTAEAKAYTRNLKLSGVEMQATDNALGQTLVEIMGDITNNGDRPVRRVALNCVFYDINGMEIMREPVAIIRDSDEFLGPEETRRFRLPFDAIPEGWNQIMPMLAIAEILFAS